MRDPEKVELATNGSYQGGFSSKPQSKKLGAAVNKRDKRTEWRWLNVACELTQFVMFALVATWPVARLVRQKLNLSEYLYADDDVLEAFGCCSFLGGDGPWRLIHRVSLG